MNESIPVLASAAGQTGTSVAIVAASITLAVVIIAITLPKILNSIKSDRIDGNVLTRLQNLEIKAIAQDAKIHRYAVRVTRLSVLVLRMQALLVAAKVPIPQDMAEEIAELTAEIEEDTP